MASHYCINCPRCKRGCSICRRCACSPAELDAWLNEQLNPLMAQSSTYNGLQYLTVTPLVTQENPEPEEEVEQRPETD